MNGITAYQEHAVTTQSRGQIVVLLYEGAIKFLRQAIREMGAGNMIEKGRLINKATEIIIELSVSLNMEAGGEIAENLRALYTFMGEQLVRANYHRDPRMIEDVIELLEELLQGWRAVAD